MIEKILTQKWGKLVLALLSGVLLTLSFPYTGSAFPLSFIAWVPLLMLGFSNDVRRWKIFLYAYLTFLIYNLGTTWWIYYASPGGAYMAFICNSLVMAVAFCLGVIFTKKWKLTYRLLFWMFSWILFEYIHFNWELSWPWLTLGNVFARVPQLVQWYSITGVLGGSLWILGVNSIVFATCTKQEISLKNLRYVFVSVLVPIVISVILYWLPNSHDSKANVSIIQPNIDPYEEKFTVGDQEQLNEILDLCDKSTRKTTELIVAPETALNPHSYVDESAIHQQTFFHSLLERKAKWNSANLLIGASTFKIFERPNSHVSRALQGGPGFIETYNSSMLFYEKRIPQVVHKSKLVLGVEKIPFSSWFPQLEEMSINLGGSSGTLGIEKNGPSIMKTSRSRFAPVVCYESIYGAFVGAQCAKGADYIAIITNDGWWKETPGYLQHFSFARLRAIENRKYVIRSANTGRSGFIDDKGNIIKTLEWGVKGYLSAEIQKNKTTTVYSILGDYLAIIALFAICTMLIIGRFTKYSRIEEV